MLTQQCNGSLSEFPGKIYKTPIPCFYHWPFQSKYLGYKHSGSFLYSQDSLENDQNWQSIVYMGDRHKLPTILLTKVSSPSWRCINSLNITILHVFSGPGIGAGRPHFQHNRYREDKSRRVSHLGSVECWLPTVLKNSHKSCGLNCRGSLSHNAGDQTTKTQMLPRLVHLGDLREIFF